MVRRLLVGPTIYTMDPACPRAEALLIEGDRILAVGSRNALSAELGTGGEVVHVPGACAMPGWVDGHTHFSEFALSLGREPLDDAANLEETLGRVRRQLERGDLLGGWLLGWGWNKNRWPDGRFPTAADLDRATADVPTALSSKDGHALWVNTAALRRAGVTRATADPEHGRIMRGVDGSPSGILLEAAQGLVWPHVPDPSDEELLGAIRRAVSRAHELGLVGVHNVEGRASRAAFGRLDRAGELLFRVLHHIPEADLAHAVDLGLQSFTGGPFLRLGGAKIFTDGALGPQTAWMLEPYLESADRGVPTHTPESLSEVIGSAVRAGISCTIHAIGDAANRMTLDALEAVMPESRAQGLRHRIEHAQLLAPADLPRLGRLGIVASMQPLHATSDRDMADRYWGERARGAYAFRTLLAHGTTLAFGSDVPVESIDPRLGLYAAVARKRADEPERPAWYPDQRLSVAEAVYAYTYGNAYAGGCETWLGRLAPGFAADLTCLDCDIFREDRSAILTARVTATWVAGSMVYQSAGD